MRGAGWSSAAESSHAGDLKCTRFLCQLGSKVPAIPRQAVPSRLGRILGAKPPQLPGPRSAVLGCIPLIAQPKHACMYVCAKHSPLLACCPGVRFLLLTRDGCSCAGKGCAGRSCGWQSLCSRWLYKWQQINLPLSSPPPRSSPLPEQQRGLGDKGAVSPMTRDHSAPGTLWHCEKCP